ncbi:carbohydrate ABC transporter substrate-binding protein [Virgibacillus siamensis]|uniref:carbohydrate ABC transporter substrate-binding protein n=1 Tax=Virgibacillus siamensis TaxID=480071 RepID=UPI0009852729|nr:carbohydrate ABC transporter substrate-binding protein [Virgibacillus siamensis]
MSFKKSLFALFLALLTIGLVACSGDEKESSAEGSDGKVTLNLAALESAYGADMWKEIAKKFEASHKNVDVKLTVEKNIEEVIRPKMQAGNYPDVMLLATGREQALTETLIKENGLENISDVLDMQVPGEDVTVKEKLLEGFTDTLATNPYGDGEMYMAPMFYSPTGLFYNAGLFKEKGWEVPATWDGMWKLGEKASKEDMSLFTYPISGYFDTLIGSMLYASGGPDFYESVMTYEDGIWTSDEATKVLETIGKLSKYVHPNTIANANPQNYTKNQQLVMENKALFMPNGTWVTGEMAEAPKADGFKWGMTSVPAFEKGGDRYAFTFFEQIWIPAKAEDKDAAKEFIAYMYSDEAASIFLKAGAVQPIEGITDKLKGQKKAFYSIYEEEGALPAMGTFASTKPVPGVSIQETLYGQIDSVISGDLTVEAWQKSLEETSDKLRSAMK